jgi:DNA modification methylase
MDIQLLCGDALEVLKTLPSESVHCIVTSPPYYGLRDYQVPGQVGLEPTPEEYVCRLVEVFHEARRVLRADGTFWLNIGDSYARAPQKGDNFGWGKHKDYLEGTPYPAHGRPIPAQCKEKDLIGVPWMTAFALRADGWYLRSEVIWAKKNPMPESVKDRPTRSHEQLFLLTKSPRYFYDAEAVKEPNAGILPYGDKRNFKMNDERAQGRHGKGSMFSGGSREAYIEKYYTNGRNRRDVWFISTRPYKGAHFATFNPELITPCVLSGTSEKGVCPKCGAPWVHDLTYKANYTKRQDRGQPDGVPAQVDSTGWKPATVIDHGWKPSCACASMEFQDGDFDLILTPTGSRAGEDPTMLTGRAGYNRPRGENEGQRPITRYEQRKYAEQLRASPHREAMADEAGMAFAHYLRTDRSGARPIPCDLFEIWLNRGWLATVEVPTVSPLDPVPATVLDPFSGAATTGVVAQKYGRNYIGIDLNPEYIEMSRKRLGVAL